MSIFKRIPIARAVYRYYWELTRPAPLLEFSDYDEYWNQRVKEGKRASILDRHRTIGRLLPENATVLDIGCGEGAFLRYLQSKRPDCKITGADISDVAIMELNKSGIEAILIDPTISLSNQIRKGWNAIVLMEVIEHVVDAESLIKDVKSLNPERIFITIPNTGFLIHRLRLMFTGRFPITSIFYHMREHVRFWTLKDFREWSKVNGLELLSYHGQVDRKDLIVNILARNFPGLFSDRMVYELKPAAPSNAQKP